MSARKLWTEDEIDNLKQDYGILSMKEMELKYNRKFKNIKTKANKMGIKSNKKKKWTKELEEEFTKDWKDRSLTTEYLQEKYSTTYVGLQSKATELKVTRRSPDLSNEEIERIIYQYTEEKRSLREIAFDYPFSDTVIKRILKENDIELRDVSESKMKYSINQDYFETIDTEEKAYYLGFIYADGCNHTPRNTLSLRLHSQDKEILVKFKKAINSSERPIYTSTKEGLSTEYSVLHITNRKISKDLEKLGVVQAKSLILKFPTEEQVPSHLVKHFLRGYFDGDGHIGVYGSRIIITVLGTDSFVTNFRDIVLQNVHQIKDTSIVKEKAKPWLENTMLIRLHGGINVEHFLDYLYKDSNIYLQRKHLKYLEVKNRETDIWSARRKIHGKRGYSKPITSDKAIEYISTKMNIGDKIDKVELFSMFIKEKDALNTFNLAYHTKRIKKHLQENDMGFNIKNGYGYIVKTDKTEASHN